MDGICGMSERLEFIAVTCVPASLQGRVWDPQGEGEIAH